MLFEKKLLVIVLVVYAVFVATRVEWNEYFWSNFLFFVAPGVLILVFGGLLKAVPVSIAGAISSILLLQMLYFYLPMFFFPQMGQYFLFAHFSFFGGFFFFIEKIRQGRINSSANNLQNSKIEFLSYFCAVGAGSLLVFGALVAVFCLNAFIF